MMNFRNELTEGKKPTKAEMKKLAGMVRKVYKSQLGAFVSAEYKDGATPTIKIKYKEENGIAFTILFQKGFGWQNSVDMGLFRNVDGDDLSKSDVILYDPNSDYAKQRTNSNTYQASISAFVRDIMNVGAEDAI